MHVETTTKIDNVLSKFENVTKTGDQQWAAKCPVHDDSKNSLSIGIIDNEKIGIHCHACGESAKPAIMRAAGLKNYSDLFLRPLNSNPPANSGKKKSKVVAIYDYVNANGVLINRVYRIEPKGFRQCRPDGKGGWIWNMKGVKRVLYNLSNIIKAPEDEIVYLVEGEKDADKLTQAGFTATTNVGGAGKWNDSYTQTLNGRHVAIIPDNDDAGRKHAEHLASELHDVAASVRVIHLPGLQKKGDISDWINAGHKKSEFQEIVESAPEWEPFQDKAEDSESVETNDKAEVLEADDDPYRLARLVAQEYTIKNWRNRWLIYEEECYRFISKEELRLLVIRVMKKEYDRIAIEKNNSGSRSEYDPPVVAMKISVATASNVLQSLA